MEPTRLAVKGLADTAPRVANDSPENRARNRRVEIIVDLSGPMEEHDLRLKELIDSQPRGDDTTVIDVRSGSSPGEDISW